MQKINEFKNGRVKRLEQTKILNWHMANTFKELLPCLDWITPPLAAVATISTKVLLMAPHTLGILVNLTLLFFAVFFYT